MSWDLVWQVAHFSLDDQVVPLLLEGQLHRVLIIE